MTWARPPEGRVTSFPNQPKESPMKFIVEPVEEKEQKDDWNHTMCVLCSEDPRWCA